MFIGHYGVSLAIKRKKPQIPIWLLFIAVQWVDVMFFTFVLLGIEHFRIVPGFTAYNPYDLYFMPYTHSLLGCLLWATAFGIASALILRGKFWALAPWIFLAVFSHYFLDVIMHANDMPLTFTSETKLGLGLWNYRWPSIVVELISFLAGLIYFRGIKTWRYWVTTIFFLVILILTPFLPIRESTTEYAISALLAYFSFAALAQWGLKP